MAAPATHLSWGAALPVSSSQRQGRRGEGEKGRRGGGRGGEEGGARSSYITENIVIMNGLSL